MTAKICPHCGGKEVLEARWVNVNTGKESAGAVLDYFYCESCRGEITKDLKGESPDYQSQLNARPVHHEHCDMDEYCNCEYLFSLEEEVGIK